MNSRIYKQTASQLLASLATESVDMIYTDPPFGTQKLQVMDRKTRGKTISKIQYSDKHEDYLAFLVPHLREMCRVLKSTGTMYLHLDQRWVHYAKVECDSIFGQENFLSEIIWSYNFGGRARDRFSAKHDNILVYAKSAGKHVFNMEEIDRIPYAAPELQYVGRTKEEAELRIAKGQIPTDVWSMSIVGTAAKERLGYPNQKPLKLVKRAIVASSRPGDLVLDPFGGSGTTGAAAHSCGRQFIMSDSSDDAVAVMRQRFENDKNIEFVE